MRLAELRLIAFGTFQNRSLRFGAPGTIDIVYGPNEAGKSTTLRAVHDLLFGVPERSPDAHTHKPKLAATLMGADGVALSVRRRKGRINTLMNENDEPIDDAPLRRMLGNVSETAFHTTWGLDHVRLREGATAMLEGKGDLGESLFAAALGSSRLHGLKRLLDEEAKEIFKPQASIPKLNAALKAYADGKRRTAELVSTLDSYNRQADGIAEEKKDKEALVARKAELGASRSRLERLAVRWREKDRLEAVVRDLEAELARVREGKATRAVDHDILAAQSTIDELRDQSLHRKALADRPKRLHDATRAREDAESTAKAAGFGTIDTIATRLRPVVSAAKERAGELDVIAGRLDERIAAVRKSIDEVRIELAGLDDPEGPTDTAELDAALAEARQEVDAQKHKRRLEKDRAARLSKVKPLDPPAPPHARRSLLPSLDDVERVRVAIDAAAKDGIEARRRVGELRDIATDLAHSIDLVAAPTEAELAKAREKRDALVKKVATAKAQLIAAIRDADALADRMRREADHVARAAHLRLQEKATREKLERAEKDAHEATERGRIVMAEYEALWSRAGVKPGSPAAMKQWLTATNELTTLEEELAEIDREIAELDTARKRREEGLARVLGKAESFDVMLARATREVDARERRGREREQVGRTRAKLTKKLETLEGELRTSDGARADVTAEWRTRASELGLPADAAPSVIAAAVRAASKALDRYDESEGFMRRVRGIDRDFEEYTARVRAVASVHLKEHADLDPFEAASRLARKLDVMRENAVALETLEERERTVLGQLAEQRRLLDELAASIAKDAEAYPDVDAVDARAAGTLDEIEEVDQAIEHLTHQIGGHEVALLRFKDESLAVSAAEDAQQALARVRHLALRYARVRLAREVLSREIEEWRSRNQGPVVERASVLFSSFTLGSFTALRIGFGDDDAPVLVGMRDGVEVHVDAMSDGTRDQLYLALRIAALERLVDTVEPLPFVLDDVLIHWDDARAAAAFRALVGLASKVQVLFFTHHSKLVEIARSAVPADVLVVHDLGERAVSAETAAS